MPQPIRNFLGDSPLNVLIRLAVLSLIVGVLLSAFNLQPLDLLRQAQQLLSMLWNQSADIIRHLGSYILLGAAIVVPIWLVMRLLNVTGRR